jgi:hypothetical protein
MRKRPTPETDAFAKAMYSRGVDSHHDGREALKHAKRLERERDEARKFSNDLTDKYLEATGHLQRERNELLKAMREILKVSEPTPVLTYQKMEDIASKALKDTAK